MRNLVNFAMTFGLNVTVMEGENFKVEVRNNCLSVNNRKAFESAIKADLNSPSKVDRQYASEMLDIVNEFGLVSEA